MESSNFNLSCNPVTSSSSLSVISKSETPGPSLLSSQYNICDPLLRKDGNNPVSLTTGTSLETSSTTTSSSSSSSTCGSVRAPSPAQSEASTGSSNNSLDLMRCKQCSVENCQEVIMVPSKRRKTPVVCNYHRNKTYKAKKKQKEQTANSFQMMMKKHGDSLPTPPNLQAYLSQDQSTSSNDGLPRLDQILNEKKLALLRSPAIIQFLRESQENLSQTRQTIKPQLQMRTPTATPVHGRHSSLS